MAGWTAQQPAPAYPQGARLLAIRPAAAPTRAVGDPQHHVSQQIRKLEETLGCVLLLREGRKVPLAVAARMAA